MHACGIRCDEGFFACSDNTCAGARSCCGQPKTCGQKGDEDCCLNIALPGGTFNRVNDSLAKATLSPFRMDKFEVTVARFRAFMNEEDPPKKLLGNGTQQHPPTEGAGKNPHNASDKGWLTSGYNSALVGTNEDLKQILSNPSDGDGLCTFTEYPGTANDVMALNCVTWYEAFAFCAWDGGRLPSDAEWNFAAAGGSMQRVYPWGTDDPDAAHVYKGTSPGPVGQRPAGAGLWGHMDLSGNVAEWVRDAEGESPIGPCNDCSYASMDPDVAYGHVLRGGNYASDQGASFSTTTRWAGGPTHSMYTGIRCVR